MTNKSNTVLYSGVTSDLIARIEQHISKIHFSSIPSKYNIEKLVYYSFFSTIEEAITEEKRIKGGSREKKIKLAESINPLWEDLWKTEISKW